ncbi:Mitochondrial carrier domain [Phytophthora cactorum]|nr:Mitochondrial carrier domain [Phytophthora cactorum]
MADSPDNVAPERGFFPALLVHFISVVMENMSVVVLTGGAVAGTSVDIALFPLDTIKTRLQSAHGFFKAGGFRGIYSGLSAAAAGSAPGGALFFSTYETSKSLIGMTAPNQKHSPLVHMAAAASAACLVRTPTEIVKQRMQTGVYKTLPEALNAIRVGEGVAGFYRGYWSMIAREIPFSFIQFPLWEVCGSIAGGVAASITTPLDVVKTRLMLGKDAKGVPYKGTLNTLSRVYTDEGLKRLFSGVGPRTMWISIGGFVFFGMYEKATSTFAAAM